MSRFRNAGFALAGLLALGAWQPVRAAAVVDDDEEPPAPLGRWSAVIGGIMDKQNNRGFEAALDYALTPATMVKLSGTSVDYTQNNPGGFLSQGLELGVVQDFGRFSLSGSLGRWQDTDILAAQELKLGASIGHSAWSAGLQGLIRRSKFNKLTFDQPVTLTGGTVLPAPVDMTCKLNNTGIGAHVRYQGSRFGGYVSAMSYQYRNAACAFAATGFAQTLHLDQTDFTQLAAPLLTRLDMIGPRRIGFENTLLASQIAAGGSWRHDDLLLSLDLSHQAETFGGPSSNTLAITAGADLGGGNGLDMTIGYTRGSTAGSSAFIGFKLRANF